MNKQTILNIVFAVAVIALFVLHFVCCPCGKHQSCPSGDSITVEGNIPVAFINVDSLLLHYTFAQEAQEQLMS